MALEVEFCRERLIVLVRLHVKLELEYKQSNTSKNRKEVIKKEIESLRTESDRLMRVISIK
ncbi:hypothetical protein D3C73_1525980 [compost metagenome]